MHTIKRGDKTIDLGPYPALQNYFVCPTYLKKIGKGEGE
jgi:hypothetical protein